MSHRTPQDSIPPGSRHIAHDEGLDGVVTSMAPWSPSPLLEPVTPVDNPIDCHQTERGAARHAALIVALPARQSVPSGPVALGSVLAEVLPLAAFSRPARLEAQGSELARRCAALKAIGAWRRAHPGASFEQDLATTERITREFGL